MLAMDSIGTRKLDWFVRQEVDVGLLSVPNDSYYSGSSRN